MVPHLNKAARESNDLDAAVIMHLYPEKWRINNVECPVCKGTAQIPSPGGTIPCKKCEGTGMANGKSPFNEVIIRPAAIGQQNIPTPPLGYVQKDTEIIKLQNERIEQHIYKALSSVNMEHLAEVQLNQSGVAKQFDRDEVNTLIYGFAGSLAYILNAAIYFITELRYRDLIQDLEKRKLLLPVIPVPEKFDVINTSFLLSEYQIARTAGLSPTILAELEKEISQKKFYANPDVSNFVQSIMDINPLSGKTIDEISMLEAAGLVTKEDAILSTYISDFVRQAMEEDSKFAAKKLKEKRDVLMKYATAKVDELNTAKQLTMDLFGTPAKPDLTIAGEIPAA